MFVFNILHQWREKSPLSTSWCDVKFSQLSHIISFKRLLCRWMWSSYDIDFILLLMVCFPAPTCIRIFSQNFPFMCLKGEKNCYLYSAFFSPEMFTVIFICSTTAGDTSSSHLCSQRPSFINCAWCRFGCINELAATYRCDLWNARRANHGVRLIRGW